MGEHACNKPRAPSVASTMTPGVDDFTQSPPNTPALVRETDGRQSPACDGRQSPACDKQGNSTPGCQDMTAPQMRKVFVGGIPKNIDQHQLRVFFNTFGKVQKAWLQKVRHGPKQTVNEHRGFGFVVFCDKSSLDTLMEDNFARFVKLENGPRVEV